MRVQMQLKLSVVLFVSRFRITAAPALGAATVAELHRNATSCIGLSMTDGFALNFEPRSMSART